MSATGARLFDRRTPPTLITLILVTSLSVLSMNAFIPSLPALASDFEADYAFIQLAVSGYLAVVGAMQLLIGPLADRYGRRPVILGGFALFVLASIGCALAEDAETFMILRMAQAGVASGMVLSRAIVRDMLPADQAASMIGYMTAAMSLTPMAAPLFGGFMEANFGWRATFWCFAALGIGIMSLVLVDLGETNPNKKASFRKQFAAYPGLLRARRFWGYALTASFASGSFFALLGGGPYVAREIFGQSPEMTGIWLGVISGGYLTGNLITGRFAARLGVTRMALTGCAVATGGLGIGVITNLLITPSPASIFVFSIFIGLGNGMTLPSATTGLLSVRPELAGSASGLGGGLALGGGAALSALTGWLLTPQSGAMPLLYIMWGSALCSLLAAFYVWRRTQALAAENNAPLQPS